MLTENITIHPCNCTAVGAIYVGLSIFGIFENLFTAILIATDSQLRNPTYYYMVNLCLADIIVLFSVGLFQGLLLLDTGVAMASMSHPAITMWLLQVGVFETTVFMILISLSRCIKLKSPHANESQTNKLYLWLSIIGPWLVFPLVYGVLFYSEIVPYKFDVTKFNWKYDTTKLVGKILEYASFGYAAVCILSVSIINVITLFYVHAARRKIQAFTDTNLKAEVKLFIQCAVTAGITFAVIIAYGVIIALQHNFNPLAPIIAHVGWLFAHIHSPIVYFALNSSLRQRFVALCLCRFQLGTCCIGQSVKVDVVRPISIVNRENIEL